MISYLTGKPIVERDSLTILVGGVGYGVHVTEKVRAAAALKTELELFIYTHVREEALDLYGFESRTERDLFLLLISVSGIGPKTALGILQYPSEQISQAVQEANVGFFAAVPRVGKKMAQKIIIELRSKLGALKELDLGPVSPKKQEIILALQSLGFDENAIYSVLQDIDTENLETSIAITQAIQKMGKK
jgi:Holliday junction DNA helicase RuvA